MTSEVDRTRRREPVPLPSDLAGARRQVRAARHRRHRRRRRVAVTLFVCAAVLVGVGLGWRAWQAYRAPVPAQSPSSLDGNDRSPAPSTRVPALRVGSLLSAPPDPSVPQTGSGNFAYVTSGGPVHGSAGALKRFRLAVETGVGLDVNAFAATIEKVLGDARGWTASGQLRLQRVPGQAAADFTVYLASPATSETLCATGGLHTHRYTSCRLSGKVIINLARWLTAVPDYGAPLSVYQAYAVNHEIGHELGYGHEACPGPGRPAPVMQQQTLGLRGCVANPWPYLYGQRYAGAKVP
jgi:Protein of unknown function (DUF3152)